MINNEFTQLLQDYDISIDAFAHAVGKAPDTLRSWRREPQALHILALKGFIADINNTGEIHLLEDFEPPAQEVDLTLLDELSPQTDQDDIAAKLKDGESVGNVAVWS